MIELVIARHGFPERANFIMSRPHGHEHFTFLHFFSPMKIRIDGKTVITKPHACIIYSPKFPQYFSSEQTFEHDWIHFCGINEEYIKDFGLKLNAVFYPERHEFITRLTRELQIEHDSDYSDKNRMIKCLFEQLFIKLSRSENSSRFENLSSSLLSALHFSRESIFSSLNQKRSVKSMADSVGLSESRFYAVYKSVFGTSPLNDIITAKTEVAKNLLLNSDKKISAIAKELGYNNVTHFTRQFKKRTGMSPDKYKKS